LSGCIIIIITITIITIIIITITITIITIIIIIIIVNHRKVVPITVRQLEALIRLSESLAKMRLASEATVSDVEEAMRLFKVLACALYVHTGVTRRHLL
jgi:hypothetical protein